MDSETASSSTRRSTLKEEGSGKRRSSRNLGKRSSSNRSGGESRSRSSRSLRIDEKSAHRSSGKSSRSLRGDELSSSRRSRSGSGDELSSSRRGRPRNGDEKAAHRSSRGPATVPGAQGELSSSRRSRSGSGDELSSSRRGRPRNGDEKAGHRSRRGPATVPGAQSELSISRRSRSGSGDGLSSSRRGRPRNGDEKAGHRSRRGPATVPGVQSELSISRRSRSGSGDELSSSRRGRPRNGDEKAGHRSSRGPATVPGVRPELSSQRSSRSNRDEKAKERRSSRAFKPGAEASTSSRDRSRVKSGGRNSSQRSVNAAADKATVQLNENGEAVVAATLIDEEGKEDEDVKKEREQARLQEIIERERVQNEAENERLRREEAERQEKELVHENKKKKKKKRNMIICVILFLLLIGGGVTAFFALQGDSSSDPVNQATDKEEETPVDSSTSPSLSPSDDPSSAPTNVPLKYNLPSDLECERIAAGLPIDGEDEMFDRSFAIPMEVDLLDGNDINPLVPDLEMQIEKLLVPDLIGCPRSLFNTRRLGHHRQTHASVMSNVSDHSRQLQNVSIRYAIAKAIVTVTVTDDTCERSSSPNCSVVSANLDLKVRGDENIALLAEVIQFVFPNGKDMRPDLELNAPFDTIVIGIMRSLDPTTAPSIGPTGITSENPSRSPSSMPSPSPESVPGTGPTDPAPVVAPTKAPSKSPTKAPTKSPTKAPTPPPTLAPTPTPPPTFAPQPGLTPEPTPPPTPRPTLAPTKAPTKSPTSNPSMAPSVIPTESPAPSLAPTSGPTNAPTLVRNGDPCSTWEECQSEICDFLGQTLVCFECSSNMECVNSPNGPRCVKDRSPTPTTANFCGPKANNGVFCESSDDCVSDLCTIVGPSTMCVECIFNSHCATSVGGPRCVIDSSPTATTANFCAPKVSNGGSCSSSEDCDSNICTYVGPSMMCVECTSNMDCAGSPAGSLCVIDSSPTATTANFCAPKVSNGDPCSASEDCESNICSYVGQSKMCVECTSNMDCAGSPAGSLCVIDSSPTATTANYCAPKASNGDPCSSSEDCESNICTTVGPSLMCVECTMSMDCATSVAGPRCVIDSSPSATTPHACAPLGSSGDPCSSSGDCASNICSTVGQSMMCVECTTNMDCTNSPSGSLCVIDYSPTPTTASYCAPLGSPGDSCSSWEQCEDEICDYLGQSMVCFECSMSTECVNSPNGPRCVKDRSPTPTTANYCGPKASNGVICENSDECESGFCTLVALTETCVECIFSSHCATSPAGPRCVFDVSPQATLPHYCAPLGNSGDICISSEDCTTGHCSYVGSSANSLCVDCIYSSDCNGSPGGPRCVINPDPEDRTPWFCGALGGTGDFCFMDADCLSGSCPMPPIVGPDPVFPVCD